MFPSASPRGTLRVEGKQNSLFPEGPVIKCFVTPPNSKLEQNCEKMICLTLLWLSKWFEPRNSMFYSTSGSQTELSYRNDSITVLFLAANKK